MNNNTNSISYNQYIVLSARVINSIVFVKTQDKYTKEIVWFIGFKTKADLIVDVRRILFEEHKYSNDFFKAMFDNSTLRKYKRK